MKAQTQLVPSRLAQLGNDHGGLRRARRPGAGGLLLASLLSVVGCGSPEPEVEPGSPLALAVYPSHPRVPQDTEEQLRIVGTFADGTTRDLSKQARWSAQAVGGGAVAMLAPGLLPASQPGQLQVTVQYGDTQLQVPVEVSAVTFKSLAVSPSGPVFAKGTTQQLAATGTYSDGSTKDLTTQVSWSVMDVMGSGVVSVDGKGLLLGKSVGKAAVSARYRTKTATTTAEVTAAALTGLGVSPSTPSIAKGTSQAFKAMGTFTDGSTQEIPSGVTWSIADLIGSGVATIDAAGVATGKALGSSTVTAAYMGKTAAATLQVTAAALSALRVDPSPAKLAKGVRKQFAVLGSYTDGSSLDLTAMSVWKAVDVTGAGVLSVTGAGQVTALSPGTAKLSATYLTETAVAEVEVTPAVLNALAVAPKTMSLSRTASRAVQAVGSYSDGTSQDLSSMVSWSAVDVTGSGVVSVDAKGVVTGRSLGTATVTASYLGLLDSSAVTVVDGFVKVPSGTTNNIWSLWAAAEDDVWAAGVAGTILHWNGTSWSAVASGRTTTFVKVWGSGARDVWFVDQNCGLLHWNGTAMASSSLSLGSCNTAYGTGPNDFWVSGLLSLARWNGTTWTTVSAGFPFPLFTGNAMWGSSPTNYWAGGTSGFLQHYQGSSWSFDTFLANDVQGLWGSGSSDVWAVGAAGSIYHYNGSAWTGYASGATGSLIDVGGSSNKDAWAVGATGMVLRWDGSKWATVKVDTTQNLFATAVLPNSVWVAGVGGEIHRLAR